MINDILCFSHLRWNFVYQRPQHLLTRFANNSRVFFIEEPVFKDDINEPFIDVVNDADENVWVVVPHLPAGISADEILGAQTKLTDALIADKDINNYVLWYYSPMAFLFSNHLKPALIIYDCMDELSAFKNAPADLIQNEKNLFDKADIVFTGGHCLYEAKKDRHQNIFPMPSAINKNDFFPARVKQKEPEDQAVIPHPRFGFYGVIDERLDLDLVDKLAALKPDSHFIFIGPVVKIDPATLPQRNNIHYLGSKNYKELPAYISGWDICIMPFALNESTQFISPTKTPEFLAAGKPVISTPITDVVNPYGNKKLVYIKNTAEGFAEAGEIELKIKDKAEWLGRVDNFLSAISWDKTFEKMSHLIEQTFTAKKFKKQLKTDTYV